MSEHIGKVLFRIGQNVFTIRENYLCNGPIFQRILTPQTLKKKTIKDLETIFCGINSCCLGASRAVWGQIQAVLEHPCCFSKNPNSFWKNPECFRLNPAFLMKHPGIVIHIRFFWTNPAYFWGNFFKGQIQAVSRKNPKQRVF